MAGREYTESENRLYEDLKRIWKRLFHRSVTSRRGGLFEFDARDYLPRMDGMLSVDPREREYDERLEWLSREALDDLKPVLDRNRDLVESYEFEGEGEDLSFRVSLRSH